MRQKLQGNSLFKKQKTTKTYIAVFAVTNPADIYLSKVNN